MKNGLLLCLIFILFHASCQKTPPIIEPENITEDCVPLGNGWREWPGYIYGLHKPSFNPNNPDEFICIEQKAGLRLIKYNLKTKERKVVTDGRISMSAGVTGIPDWGVNDWILFEITREGMFKIKSNGDSLTRLTTRKWWYYYSWNPDGKYYIHDGIICNAQNEAIDTIEFRGGNWKYHPTLMIRNAGGLQITI